LLGDGTAVADPANSKIYVGLHTSELKQQQQTQRSVQNCGRTENSLRQERNVHLEKVKETGNNWFAGSNVRKNSGDRGGIVCLLLRMADVRIK
jgi:hypothetical protein